jgi:hypothetical protein
LRSADPDLAERFENAARELEELAYITEVPSRPSGTTQPHSSLKLSDISNFKVLCMSEWDSILESIRAIPQFSTYLKPRSYSQLKEISYRGPVFIINLASGPG